MDKFERRTGIVGEDIAFLNKVPLFADIDDETIRDMLSDSAARHYPRNTVVFVQEEEATHFYVVLEGLVKLFRQTEDGHEIIISIMTRGDVLAHAAMFGGREFPATATVVDDARLISIPADSYRSKMRSGNCDVCFSTMSMMSNRVRQLMEQVEQQKVRSSSERVADFLAGSCPEESGPTTVELRLDKWLIAGRLGMQPETLSRALARLRSVGVECIGNEVTIEDVGALRDYCESKEK